MRKAAAFLIGAFALMVIVGLTISSSLVVMQRIAHVSGGEGTVELKKATAESFVALGAADYVRAGDTIRTGEDSTVTLNWANGERILMGPLTTLQVLKCQMNRTSQAETSVFRLDVGHIWIRILKILSGQSKFEIHTPTATAGVRGTVFSVGVDANGETEVEVFDGKVALTARGQTTEVTAGKRIHVSAAGLTTSALEPEARSQWERRGDVLGPALELYELPSGNALPKAGEHIAISGKAERGATVTVNGEAVETDARGRFDILLTAPSEDEMTIEVTATDAKGMTTRRLLHLKR